MKIFNIYKIGMGPSSSHTMGPRRAAEIFAKRLAIGDMVQVELFGSLAATGKGHLTDTAILAGLKGFDVKLIWNEKANLPAHPNGMRFTKFNITGQKIDAWEVYSIGGGELFDGGRFIDIASHNDNICKSLNNIMGICFDSKKKFWQYAIEMECGDGWNYLSQVFSTMCDSIMQGLSCDQMTLKGSLNLPRRAKKMKQKADQNVGFVRDLNLVSSYALAVAEQNASGGTIVTAPTCGSSGVLPAVLYYFFKNLSVRRDDILKALATAGLFAKVVATRASISGAEVGCQGEIGTACAMACAAVAQLQGGNIRQIEYAAEMGLEHCLGLTCDPIDGLVQIPCIERNAFAAMRAMECAAYALATDGIHLISFDNVTDVMYVTGKDLQSKYRETAAGGLAKIRELKIIKRNT